MHKLNTHLVRLSSFEFAFLSKLKKGEKFTHFNLLHPQTIVRTSSNDIYFAVLILKNGNLSQDPILNLVTKISIKLISFDYISFEELKMKKDLVFDRGLSLLDSIYNRYNPVFGYNKDELRQMKYYIRVFEII